MSGPPKNVSASALWLKLQETPRPSDVVDFPRSDEMGNAVGRVRIQVLNMEDHDRARIWADKKFKDAGDSPVMREVMGDQVAKELLAMACFEAEPVADIEPPIYRRIFADARQLDSLTADELAVLFNHYITIQHKYGPYEKTIESEADLNLWIKRLEEGGSEHPLGQLTLPQLVQLAYMLARRAYTLSHILGSQLSTLPDSLVLKLETYSMGTGFYGEPQESSTQTSSESSETRDLYEAIDADEAMRRALEMRK